MATIVPTTLRNSQQYSDLYLSISKPATLLTAQVNGTPTRGQRSISFDTGSSPSFATIATGQRVVFDTQYGLQDALLKAVTGTAASGTIEIYENGLAGIADNDPVYIYHDHSTIYPIPPAIRSGIFYKFFDQIYSDQNTQPKPVAIIGSHRAGFLDSGSCVFSLNSSSSYAIASGATISSRVWSCVHNGGGTTGISFSSTTAANPTLTITVADQYWLTCIVTDSNGKTQSTTRCLFVHDRPGGDYPPYLNFSIQSMSGDWDTGGWRTGFEVSGDQTLTDFPDQTLAVIWHENFFNGSEAYINLWGISDEIVTCGYLRQDTDRDNWSGPDQAGGTGTTSFQLTTPDDVLNNKTPLGSVSLNAVTTPAYWYEYASWMTTGRSIHHLLLWQAFGVFQACDVLGLTTNTLGVLQTDYTEPTLLQQVNGFAFNRGIFAKMISDRLGRLHLVADSQMLNTAARAALDTVFTLTDADVSGIIDVVRAPEKTTTFTDLNGFAFDGATSTPFISIIPGYRESSISYIIPENTGGATASIGNQVLASQTDSNEKIGRYQALQNVNPREVRLTNPSNYMGAWDIVPSIGWYNWGIADASLKRQIELFGRKFLCRHVDIQFLAGEVGYSGSIQTSVVLQPEAIGPDGIQGNYPTGYPTTVSPEPDWDSDAAVETWDFVVAFQDTTQTDGRARVGSVGPLASPDAYTFNAGAVVSEIAVCATSSSSGVVCYRDSDTQGKAVAFTRSGTVLTFGSEVAFNATATSYISCVALTSTSVLVAYRDSDTFGKVQILTISGTTVTANTEYIFDNTGAITGTGVARLSATIAVVSAANAGTAEAFPLGIAGTVITIGTGQGTTESGTYTSICALDSGTAVICYAVGSNPMRAKALTGITASSFTYGASIEVAGDVLDTIPGIPFIAKLDSSRVIIAYQHGVDFKIYAIALSLSGSTLTVGSAVVVSTLSSGYDEMATIGTVKSDGSQAVIAFDTTLDQRIMSVAVAGLVITNNADEITTTTDDILFSAMGILKTVGS